MKASEIQITEQTDFVELIQDILKVDCLSSFVIDGLKDHGWAAHLIFNHQISDEEYFSAESAPGETPLDCVIYAVKMLQAFEHHTDPYSEEDLELYLLDMADRALKV